MGAKTFENNTQYALAVMLTVRSDPTNTKSFALDPHGRQAVRYSDDHNPYLDGILVDVVDKGNSISRQDFILHPGSTLETEVNTHDTVIFNLTGDSLVMGFGNDG